MSKQEADLIHYQNKCKQLQYLLEEEREKNSKLKKILAELRFEARSWLSKLDKAS